MSSMKDTIKDAERFKQILGVLRKHEQTYERSTYEVTPL